MHPRLWGQGVCFQNRKIGCWDGSALEPEAGGKIAVVDAQGWGCGSSPGGSPPALVPRAAMAMILASSIPENRPPDPIFQCGLGNGFGHIYPNDCRIKIHTRTVQK